MISLLVLLVVLTAKTITVDAQDVVVGLEHTLYVIPEGASVQICAQIISPDDIGSLEFTLQIILSDDTPTEGDVATEDTENPIFGGFQMAPGSDYRQPLSGAPFQILEKPFSQSTRSVCYEQLTYNDTDEENDEYFIVELVTSVTTPSNILIEETLSRTLVRIVDDDGTVVCPGLSDPVNGVLTPTGTNTGDSAAFTCNSGFELVGASVVHCLSNGTWDKPSPTCLTPAVISFAYTSYTVTEGLDEFAQLILMRNGSLATITSAIVATFDASANAGSDYSAVHQEVFFSPEDSRTVVNIPILDDDIAEDDEIFIAVLTDSNNSHHSANIIIIDTDVACPVLSHPKKGKVFTTGVSVADTATFTCSTGYELVGDSTLTCQSDGTWDSPPPVCQGPSVIFEETAYTVTEGVDEFVDIIILTKNIKNIVVVNVSLIPDSAKDGSDFLAISKVIALAPGETEDRVRVPIIDDSIAEDTETFTATLSTGDVDLDSNDIATVTILDDDHKTTGSSNYYTTIIIVTSIGIPFMIVILLVVFVVIMFWRRKKSDSKIDTTTNIDPIYDDLDSKSTPQVENRQLSGVAEETKISLQELPQMKENIAYCTVALQQTEQASPGAHDE